MVFLSIIAPSLRADDVPPRRIGLLGLGTVLLLLVLVLTVCAVPSAASKSVAPPPAGPTIEVDALRFDDADLLVALDYAAVGGGITIQILVESGRTGAVVRSTTVDLPVDATELQVVVGDVVGALPAHGDAYTVRVVAADGTALARDQAFKARLRCPTATSCSVVAWTGIDAGSGAVALPEALSDALRAAAASTTIAGTGWIDLRALEHDHPELRGDLYSLVSTLEAEGAAPDPSSGVPDGCVCLWTLGVAGTQAQWGETRLVVYEGTPSPAHRDLEGRLSADFLCVRPASTDVQNVLLPGGTVLDLDALSDLEVCPHDCSATAAFGVDTTIGAAAFGSDQGALGAATTATGDVTATWLVDGQMQDVKAQHAGVQRAPFQDPQLIATRKPMASTAPARSVPSETFLEVRLDADFAVSSAEGRAIGEAAIDRLTTLSATLQSSCLATEPTTAAVEPFWFADDCCKDYVSLLDGNP